MNETVIFVLDSKTKSLFVYLTSVKYLKTDSLQNSLLHSLYRELDWLTLEGWINYMDILTGKTFGDFSKPQDLAASMGSEFGPRAGVRHWSEQNNRVTRAMLVGNVRL